MDTYRILEALETLPLADLQRIDRKLHTLIDRMAAWQQRNQETPPTKKNKTYQQEYVRCSRKGCTKCEYGQGHGPYWYAYWWEGGKLRKKYIGKEYREI